MSKLKLTLTDIITERDLHGRFLNTISFMESWGSQKIAGMQKYCNGSEEILQHAAEEARHALFFKSLAKKLAGDELDSFDGDDCILRNDSRRYLDRLNILVSKAMTEEGLSRKEFVWHCYLWVTLLIEERAMDVYGIYQSLQEEYATKTSVKSILREEIGHLAYIKNVLTDIYKERFDEIADRLFEREERYFDYFLNRLSQFTKAHSQQKLALVKKANKEKHFTAFH